MRTPLLILAAILAIVLGLGIGALMGVIAIGLVIGLVGASVLVLALWGAGKAVGIGADSR